MAGIDNVDKSWKSSNDSEPGELELSKYDLLCEEDPEEFVAVEHPSTGIQTEDTPLPGSSEQTHRPGFLGNFRRRSGSPSVQKRLGAMLHVKETQHQQVQSNESEVGDSSYESCPPPPPPTSSSPPPPPPTPATDPIPPSSSSSSTTTDPSLRSDMLMSLSTTYNAADMSVRHSVHLGLAAADLKLTPPNEEIVIEASRLRLGSVETDTREYEDEDVESPTWTQHKRHVFVLSISGKPVYSRYGKEDRLVNLFGIMQALVSFVQDDRDNLKSVIAGDHHFAFVCRGPLVLVSVACSSLSDTQLSIQLMYVYYQILSVLTNTQLKQIFERSPGFDLRYLLQGSEKFVDNVLKLVDSDPSFMMAGVRCLYMPVPLRQTITSILMQCRTKDVLFAVIVADNQLVTYIKPKDHNLFPIDVHLIINLVDASTSFRSAESWTPICLPKFNDTGFLHAHVSYLPDDSPACMLLISTNKEKFFDLQQCQQRIFEKFEKHGVLGQIQQAVADSHYTIDHLQAPEIRHYVYKSRKTSSVTSPRIPVVYRDEKNHGRLMDLYMWMHQKIHSQYWPAKILYHVGEKEALLGWRTTAFDLYAVFDPLIAKGQAILLGNKLIRWINKEEERLVITSSHTF